jgi:hypothetical protein
MTKITTTANRPRAIETPTIARTFFSSGPVLRSTLSTIVSLVGTIAVDVIADISVLFVVGEAGAVMVGLGEGDAVGVSLVGVDVGEGV